MRVEGLELRVSFEVESLEFYNLMLMYLRPWCSVFNLGFAKSLPSCPQIDALFHQYCPCSKSNQFSSGHCGLSFSLKKLKWLPMHSTVLALLNKVFMVALLQQVNQRC